MTNPALWVLHKTPGNSWMMFGARLGYLRMGKRRTFIIWPRPMKKYWVFGFGERG